MNEIVILINCYLNLKYDYKEYNKENLYDVFTIFFDEVFELTDIVNEIDYKINIKSQEGYSYISNTVNMIFNKEEELLNEIADVLLTTARLIKEFKLEEPLTEMLEYKLHRQITREEKLKNERLK